MYSSLFSHQHLLKMMEGLDKKYQLILYQDNYESIIR